MTVDFWRLFGLFLALFSPYIILRYGMLLLFPEDSLIDIVNKDNQTTKTAMIQRLDDNLIESQPQVILVGSSILGKGVNNGQLASVLGIPKSSVVKIISSGAAMPTMTAIVSGRIVANDLQPKLIVVVTTPRWLLTNKINRQLEFDYQFTHPTDELLKAIGRTSEAEKVFTINKTELREKYLSTIRKTFGQDLFDLPDDTVVSTLNDLFTYENRREKRTSVLPVSVSEASQPTEKSNEMYPLPPNDLLLYPHLIELSQQNGSNIIFVEFPVSETIKANHSLPLKLHVETANNIIDSGAGYLSYFNTQEQSIFSDSIHLNPRGSRLFTEKLANDILELNGLGEMKRSSVPTSLRVPTTQWKTVESVIPKRYTEETERNWLYPGESITVDVAKVWENEKILLQMGSEGQMRTKPTLTLGGENLDTEVVREGDNIWYVTAALPALSESRELVIGNPENGELVYVYRLSFGEEYVVPRKKATPVLANSCVEVTPNSTEELQVPWQPADRKSRLNKLSLRPDIEIGDMSRLDFLSSDNLQTNGIPCQPLILRQNNGIPLEQAPNCHFLVKKDLRDNFCTDDGLAMLLTEHLQGETLSFQLQRNRICQAKETDGCVRGSGVWIYPKDNVQLRIQGGQRHTGYTHLVLNGATFGEGQWSVTIQMEDGTETTLLLSKFEVETKIWLKEPIFDTEALKSIEIGGDNFAFVSSLSLSN